MNERISSDRSAAGEDLADPCTVRIVDTQRDIPTLRQSKWRDQFEIAQNRVLHPADWRGRVCQEPSPPASLFPALDNAPALARARPSCEQNPTIAFRHIDREVEFFTTKLHEKANMSRKDRPSRLSAASAREDQNSVETRVPLQHRFGPRSHNCANRCLGNPGSERRDHRCRQKHIANVAKLDDKDAARCWHDAMQRDSHEGVAANRC